MLLNYSASMKILFTLLIITTTLPLCADRVTLVSGEVLEGEILTENSKELIFETARTRSRTYRIVHHLSHEVVKSVNRTNPKPQILPELTPGSFTQKVQSDFALVEYNAQEMKDTLQQDTLIDQGQFDEAINKYQMVAEQSYEAFKAETNVVEKGTFLTIQQNAYQLWIVAIEGKVDTLKEKEKRLEDTLDNELEAAEDQLEALRDRVAQQNRSSRTVRLGSGRTTATAASPAEQALLARVKRAQSRLSQFDTWKQQNGAQIKSLEAEAAVIDEKSDQTRDELKVIQREIRDLERLRR